jgi:hypothetical protein
VCAQAARAIAFFEAGTSTQAHRLASLACDEAFQDASDVIREIEVAGFVPLVKAAKRSPSKIGGSERTQKRVSQ